MRFLQALTASLALALTPMTLAMDTNFLLDRTWRKRAVAAQNRLRAQQDQKRSAKDALPAKSPFLNPKSASECGLCPVPSFGGGIVPHYKTAY